jgi:uncharacterized membrane protein
MMTRLIKEVQDDARFIQSHTLQPKWYKTLKVFILLGFLLGYSAWGGWVKTLIFLVSFLIFGLVIHLVYRVQTHKWQRSWLDFVVVEENGQAKPKSIGKFYYTAVLASAVLSFLISQTMAELHGG